MRTRFFAFTAIAVLLINVAAFSRPDTAENAAKRRQVTRLVSMLPASDAVAVFDAKRFLNDALPKLLSSNAKMMAEVTSKLTEMETRTGIDLRKFEQVAVGVAFKQVSAKEMDYDTVAVASGDVNAGALVAVARLASKGTYRTEKIGERTVYVFSAKDVIQKNTVTVNNSKVAGVIEDALKGISKDIAVTAFDSRTLVMGSLPRVTETLEARSHVGTDVSSMLATRETAVASFAARTPPGGMSKILPLDTDDFGASIDAIQFIAGSVDVATAGASVSVLARTKQAEQAQNLRETLEGLQMLGKAVFGSSKRADQQVYGRMIRAAKFESVGTDLTFNLLVPQSDIDVLVGGIK